MVRAQRGFEVTVNVIVQPRNDLGRPSKGNVIIDVVTIVIDGWHVESAVADHFGNGIVVHVGGVLDGIGPGAHCVFGAIGPVGVNGEAFAVLVGQIGSSAHLLIGVGLESGDVLIGAG